MKFYPVCINIQNKKIVIIGGGKVAERKIKGLLPYNAKIILVSPDLTNYLEKLVKEKRIKYINKKYSIKVIKNAFLVFACTSDSAVNKKIFSNATRQKIMVNVCDKTELCDFTSPAVVKRNGLTIAISTDGKNPELSKRFKEVMENEFLYLWNKL